MRQFLSAWQRLYGAIVLRQSQWRVFKHIFRDHLQYRLFHSQLLQGLPLLLLIELKHLHCCPLTRRLFRALQAIRDRGWRGGVPQMRPFLRGLHFPHEFLCLLGLCGGVRDAAAGLPGVFGELQDVRDCH